MDQARQLYVAGAYAAAAQMLDALEPYHRHDGSFFLNQGNAHLLAGRLGEAVFALRRAERLWPGSGRVRAGLSLARSQVAGPFARQSSAVAMGQPWLELLAVLLYLAAWIPWFAPTSPRRKLLATITGALALAYLTWSMGDRLLERRHPLAVVRRDGVTLRLGNGESYAPVLWNGQAVSLSPGVEARILNRRPNGWVQVRLEHGVIGWLPETAILHEPW